MTPATKMEYSKIVAKRYLLAKNRKEKGKIIDEFAATLEYHRKSAIRKLNTINFKDSRGQRKSRERLYSGEADALLVQIWQSYGCVCGERLHPFIAEGMTVLERLGYIDDSSDVKKEVLSMSMATVKRRISGHQNRFGKGKGLSATKPGSLLKKKIPIKTNQWDESKPGYCEIDLVAHCGGTLLGDFIYTLQFVCIKTTWTERSAVMGKGQTGVFKGIKKIEKQLPFDLLGLDSDNGGEFINHQLWKYCGENNIDFTRSRPYMKKDNAHIEQKNWPLVRKILGYDRFDTQEQLDLINDLYDNELRLFINFFQPTMKLKEKIRVGSKYKRKYDKARTPYQRVLECPEVPEEKKEELRKLYVTLDPIKLKKAIDEKVAGIIKLAEVSKQQKTSDNALEGKCEGKKRKKTNKNIKND